MKVNVGTKVVNIPDKEIEALKKSLDIDTAEAVELWLDDNDYTTNEEQENLDKKAKTVKIDHGAGDVRKKADRKPKERKVDVEKGELITKVKEMLEGMGIEITGVKTETELSFVLNNNNYTFKLTKHRPPKK